VIHFDVANLKIEYDDLQSKMTESGFWEDNEKAQIILKRSKTIENKLEFFENISVELEDAFDITEMALEENDESFSSEIISSIESMREKIEKLSLETLLSGKYDKMNCILSIHAGTGGLDAQDWAEMLLRMYKKWTDRRGFSVKILDLIRDTEAGIKTVALLVEGENAYGYLKSEKGVHRLVRISPFDSSGKRHTSFASVDIMPELDDSIVVEINPVDLKIDTFRASGAGGQHVNTTDSAIRITHIPTGVVVQCQNERSQTMNKNTAMKMLMAKLIEIKEEEQMEEIKDLKGDYSQIAWGSQIRSYVFNPYNMVKDHRTNAEVGNVHGVMDGDIDIFINEFLKKKN
jgi:peptide chain release factor 2